MQWKVLAGVVLAAISSAKAENVASQELGTVGTGTAWEAKVFAAYDKRMFSDFGGCLAPVNKDAYVAALQDKASRAQLQSDFDALVQPSNSPFRQVLSNTADANATLKSVVNAALLDTLNGPRTAYWPGVQWTDNGKRGEVGFEPCTATSFRIEKKETRVVRTQTKESLVKVAETLQANGQAAPVTLNVFTVKVTVAAPNEAPGAVQLLGDGNKRYCFTAQNAQGAEVTSFSAYTPGSDGYKVAFAELTKLLKSNLDLVKELSPFYHYAGNTHLPTAKSDAYSVHYGPGRLEQDDLGIQIGTCEKFDEPYQTDQLEYLYLKH